MPTSHANNVTMAQLQILAVFCIAAVSMMLIYGITLSGRSLQLEMSDQLERVVNDVKTGKDTDFNSFLNRSARAGHVTIAPAEHLPFIDQDLDDKFDEMCGAFWSGHVAQWVKKIAANKRKDGPLRAIQRRSGAGDRMSGLVTALMTSVQKGKRLSVHWKNLDGAFTTSSKLRELSEALDVNMSEPLVEISGAAASMPYRACYQRSFYECSPVAHSQDHCPIYLRSCVGSQSCNKLKEIHEKRIKMAHVLGCALRVMMSPTMELMHHEISWFIDGKVVNGTVLDLVHVLKRFHVVSVHIRRGDGAFKGGSAKYLKPLERDLTQCVKQVEEQTFGSGTTSSSSKSSKGDEDEHGETEKEVKKETRWFMASDDPNLKAYFREEFPNKTIQLLFRPHHMDYIKRIKRKSAERDELKNLFSEWFLLGRGDELITNDAHPHFGVSSFSRTAWLYNLKSDFYILKDYDRKFCIKRAFKYKGNVNKVHRNCRNEGE